MKPIKSIITIIAIAALFFSCKKDDSMKPNSVGFNNITVQTTDTLFAVLPIEYNVYSRTLVINTINTSDYDSIVLNKIYRTDGTTLVGSDDVAITDFKETGARIDRFTGVFVLTDSLNLKQGMHAIDIAIFKDGNSRVFEKAYYLSIEGELELISIPFEETTITVKSGDAYTSDPIVYNLNGYDPVVFSLSIYDSEGDGHDVYATKAIWEKMSTNKSSDFYGIEVDKQGRIIVHSENNLPVGSYDVEYIGSKERTWVLNWGSYFANTWYYVIYSVFTLEVTN